MQFGISPPSWEVPKPSVRVVAEPAAESLVPPGGDAFVLQGVLGAKSSAVLGDLREFAAGQAEVALDFSQLDRIEFSSVSMLMETLIALTALGKRVSIVHSNMLVYVLLVVMGIDQIAQIAPSAHK